MLPSNLQSVIFVNWGNDHKAKSLSSPVYSKVVDLSRIGCILDQIVGPKVLDIGCTAHNVLIGEDHWLHGQLRKTDFDVFGIDISSENIELLRRHGYDNLFVQSAESFDLPEKFNTIVAGEVIEHVSNPGKMLESCAKHLEADGRIVLTTPYTFALVYTLNALLSFPQTCRNDEHTCWFCPTTLEELARRHSLKVVHFELVDGYRPDSPHLSYRLFVRAMQWLRWLLPKRIRYDTMLFVLTVADKS